MTKMQILIKFIVLIQMIRRVFRRKEVEKILANKNPMEILRISLFPIQSVEYLKWLLNNIKHNATGTEGDMAFELADVLMSVGRYGKREGRQRYKCKDDCHF
ncbi:hypothetical protein P9E06_14575 [Bacillus mojavensis]|uniref:hypothetical protein n=1 Tax=Bacillus mojavensis TaxID=72360 RepID=UPI002DBFD38B|nr:hypothetical protein [Bacillus mojavensis]MEC1678899.1 hypothetical protein [Bacillus mojavensis]MEC1713040.1 hypothetical protein [Bacillus mojavensis]